MFMCWHVRSLALLDYKLVTLPTGCDRLWYRVLLGLETGQAGVYIISAYRGSYRSVCTGFNSAPLTKMIKTL